MPLNIDWQQILLHLLNFCILAGGLYFLLYKPVKQFMDSRTAHYRQLEEDAEKALQAAAAAKQEADSAKASLRETLQQEREQAMERLKKDSQRQLDQTARQADHILKEAEKSAQLRKEKALQESQQAIRDLAITAAAKLALQSDPYDQFLESAEGRDRHGERT